MKYQSYREYDPRRVAMAESALFTVWPILEPWYDDVVIVGGLVPRFLCGDVSASRTLPRPVTLDADVGIALGASAGGMSSLQLALNDAGFHRTTSPEGLIRYAKQIGDYNVPLDFLTEYPPHTKGTATVDDVVASVLPGIDRALATARQIKVNGVDLYGATQENLPIRVCEAGPFLAMKLRAFADRQAPKDAFDILYTVLHYDRGMNAAVAAFAEEIRAGNPACKDAITCLNQHFRDEQSSAPVRAASFVLGQVAPGESDDIRLSRLQIQQDMVDAGRLLQKALIA